MSSSGSLGKGKSPENSPDPPKWQFWRKPKPPVDPETEKYPPLPFWQLFRYSTQFERLIMLLSLVAAVCHGAILPILTVLFGDVIDEFALLFLPPDDPNFVPVENTSETLADVTNRFLILSFVAFALSFLQLYFALIFANRVGNTMRRRFFETLLRQDCDFYDDSEAGALTNLVVNDINLVQAGIGDKVATATQYLSTFSIGIVIGFAYGWKLTLLVLLVTPVLLGAGLLFGNASAGATGDGLGAYGEAGAIATETFSLIRTITAFGGQEEEVHRYEKSLDNAYKSSVKAATISGMGLGFAMFSILFTYALAMWFGARLVRNDEISAGDVLLTFFAISLGANSLGTAGPAFKSFAVARAAASRVFEIIERKSPIDPLAEDGIIPTTPVKGNIRFVDVDFNYKKRITEDGDADLVLDMFNLDIPAGSSEAFVGKSGSGKSTVARLIARQYDPLNGSVLFDGMDIRTLNVRWLRSQIGVVSQMPSLFMLSIRDNIALGAGVEYVADPETGVMVAKPREVTQDEIITAAKMANAHTFITRLPEGYDTMLGERGAMLSGGQKQRVCIARALVRNPKILLLDESTASLDTASEKIVQDALEKASEGRTTITIAHRLSTVRNSDNISCIQRGKVIERGPHDDLVKREGGFYHGLFELQMVEKAKMDKENIDDEKEMKDDNIPLPPAMSMDVSVTKTGQESVSHIPGTPDNVEDEEPAIDKGVFMRTLKMNSGELVYMIAGSLGAIVAGVTWPITAIVLVEVITIMIQGNDESDIIKWCVGFLVIATASFIGNGLQHGILGVAGEKLTRKVRALAFRALLKQEIGYFDMKENSVGAITGRLSTDAGAMKGLTADLFGVGINVVAAIGAGLIIAFVNCWRLTLVVLAIIPGIALGGYFEMQASAGFDAGARKDFASANALASEAVDNVGTVRSLGVESYFSERFATMIGTTVRGKNRKALLTGFAFGFSEFCQILIWYATFKAGGDFVSKQQCTFSEMLLSSMAILFGAITLGNVSVFAPDIAASRIGATHIYRLLDRTSEIDPTSDEGEPMDRCHGVVSAKNVKFEYPRRPDVPVLRGLTVEIANAKTLALVGTSGHGKSTIISLLERFYSIRDGTISVDDQDIAHTSVSSLRSHIGLVSQEPELFNRSVFDNIAYGVVQEQGRPITMEEIVDAAKQANAHEFIELLPDGYDTIVGARGEALSGGQRQRVAIARSLIRKPAILLLDEATSALDSSSERIVQDALDKAAAGRTSIVIAHRLSTIKDADVIAVVRKGRIVESGSHDELLRRNGHYADLVKHQLSEV